MPSCGYLRKRECPKLTSNLRIQDSNSIRVEGGVLNVAPIVTAAIIRHSDYEKHLFFDEIGLIYPLELLKIISPIVVTRWLDSGG